MRDPIQSTPPKRRGLALVPTREDGHPPTAVPQGSGKLLHHRGFACAPHGQISHDHHQAPQRLIVKDALAVEPEPRLRNPAEQVGQRLQKRSIHRRPGILTPPKNHFDGISFEAGEFFLQPGRHATSTGNEVDGGFATGILRTGHQPGLTCKSIS